MYHLHEMIDDRLFDLLMELSTIAVVFVLLFTFVSSEFVDAG